MTLKNSNAPDEPEEVVHAKFVLGSDGKAADFDDAFTPTHPNDVGAHSWVRKALGITMIGDQTDSVWGVIDVIPVTDFPYIRCKAVIPANSGTVINIPREDDKTRLYVQMKERAGIDEGTRRLDKNKLGPDDILNVSSS